MKPDGRDPGLPSLDRLTAGLATALRPDGSAERVTVLARERNRDESTFPTEIVTCRVGRNRSPLRLFIKYGTSHFNRAFGHRGDVAFEARVYRDVLQPLRMSTPTFYGLYETGTPGVAWLIIEYVKGGIRTSQCPDPKAMIQAARWIGRFHAANERRPRSRSLAFLRRYDEAYYRGWPQRTERACAPYRTVFPWVAPMCREFRRRIPTLVEAPHTVIHGEYFGANILYQNGTSRPLDWQSTAVAPGEIDLVSLTHSFPTPVQERCVREYTKSRWPGGAPEAFDEIVAAARLYVDFRWLGDPKRIVLPIGRTGNRLLRKRARRFLKDLHDAETTLAVDSIPVRAGTADGRRSDEPIRARRGPRRA